MAKFDELMEEIKEGIAAVAKKEAKEFVKEARKDAEAFIEKIREDLIRWTDLVLKGKLTPEELKFLLGANRDLAKMKALTKKGLAKARIDRIVDGTMNVVVSSVTGLL